jgi:hypothetical protein
MHQTYRVSFQREFIRELNIEEFAPLYDHQNSETGHFKDMKVEPELAMYQRAEDHGALRLFTVRDNGKLIGYQSFVVTRGRHHAHTMQAQQDLLYISPDRRGFGLKFIKWCDEQLKAEGVHIVHQHVTPFFDFGPMLKRVGYELSHYIYIRRLN